MIRFDQILIGCCLCEGYLGASDVPVETVAGEAHEQCALDHGYSRVCECGEVVPADAACAYCAARVEAPEPPVVLDRATVALLIGIAGTDGPTLVMRGDLLRVRGLAKIGATVLVLRNGVGERHAPTDLGVGIARVVCGTYPANSDGRGWR